MKDRSSYTVPSDVPRGDTTEPLGLVLTCRSCQRPYQPCAEDFETGRLSCPHAGCRGWSWTAALVDPGYFAGGGGDE